MLTTIVKCAKNNICLFSVHVRLSSLLYQFMPCTETQDDNSRRHGCLWSLQSKKKLLRHQNKFRPRHQVRILLKTTKSFSKRPSRFQIADLSNHLYVRCTHIEHTSCSNINYIICWQPLLNVPRTTSVSSLLHVRLSSLLYQFMPCTETQDDTVVFGHCRAKRNC